MNVTNPQQIIDNFEKLLDEVIQNHEPIISIIEQAITLCSLALLDLREIVITRGFETREEEIFFFKHLKSRVYSKFIYYAKLFKIVCRRPVSTKEIQKRFFNEHLEAIEKYTNDNFEFYQYHKRGLTFLDDKFYTRENAEIPPNLDNLHFLIDKSFSTMQDYTLSTLLGNEMLTEYIKTELEKLEQSDSLIVPTEDGNLINNAQWTGSKTALVELIYAVHSCKVVNYGEIDIKKLVNIFEKALNIDLGDFYRTFLEIRNRKIDKTKFIDTLKQSLLNRMDDADAK